MKKTILFFAATLSVAAVQAATSVVLERVTHVGFAPPQHVGKYTFQVLSDGKVQTIDNKQNKEVIAKISKSQIESLKAAVEQVKETEILLGNGPACMDAPTTKYQVYQASGKKIEVIVEAGCKEAKTSDVIGAEVGQITKDLDSAFQGIKYIKNISSK